MAIPPAFNIVSGGQGCLGGVARADRTSVCCLVDRPQCFVCKSPVQDAQRCSRGCRVQSGCMLAVVVPVECRDLTPDCSYVLVVCCVQKPFTDTSVEQGANACLCKLARRVCTMRRGGRSVHGTPLGRQKWAQHLPHCAQSGLHVCLSMGCVNLKVVNRSIIISSYSKRSDGSEKDDDRGARPE